MSEQVIAYRSSILHFPRITDTPDTDFVFYNDGLLVTRNGKIAAMGEAESLIQQYPQAKIEHFKQKLIVPGLIDSHLHFPQTEMIASFGEQLLEWLQNYTFPTEHKFRDEVYASAIAKTFIHQLFANGTTTAAVFSSVHQRATNALFEVAQQHNMCLIAGKVCMDRNCPPELQDTPQQAQRQSAELIQKWHNKDRLHYAITPRFAPTSSPEQLAALQELAQQYPDVFIQTHLSENKHEIEWVKQLFPQFDNYLQVYEHYGLVRKRALFGHCLHLEESEWHTLKQHEAVITFCPSSNLFLGSGLFDLDTARKHQVPVSLASDVGAGTSFNMLRILGEAYKVCQMRQTKLSALQGLYMMTQGSAVNLDLAHSIGNLNPNTDADFIVLDPKFNSLSELRTAAALSTETVELPADVIFALSMLADERAIAATYVAGKQVFVNN